MTCFTTDKLSEMLHKVRPLVPEERVTFDIALKYTKKPQNTRKKLRVPTPNPFLNEVYGGAGSGKSTITKCINDWCEKEPTSFGASVDRLYVIRTVFTVVDELKMHSAFKLNFGNMIGTWRTQASQQANNNKPL